MMNKDVTQAFFDAAFPDNRLYVGRNIVTAAALRFDLNFLDMHEGIISKNFPGR